MKEVDVIVVGGGIHGAGVAQAVAAAGHSVLVVEKSKLAAGTSCKSSKLIHGGLRYLESGQYKLVRECLQEREILCRNAPDLVRHQKFHIPIYKGSSRPAWQIFCGLSLYAILGGMRKEARFRCVPKKEWAELDGIETEGLKAVFQYYDGQTDDAALTRAVMRSAQTLNAELMEDCQFMSGRLSDEGVEVDLMRAGSPLSCSAKVLVNAAGPWVNEVLERVEPAQRQRSVELVQGAHIEFAGKLDRGMYYIENPEDRRAIFMIPWKGRIMMGTTETHYTQDPEDARARSEEVEYLLSLLPRFFPQYGSVTRSDLHSEWAGFRVLPGAQLSGSSKAFNRPRETILQVDRSAQPRLLSIYGGKLTAYRAVAERVAEKIASSLPHREAVADTKELSLEPNVSEDGAAPWE